MPEERKVEVGQVVKAARLCESQPCCDGCPVFDPNESQCILGLKFRHAVIALAAERDGLRAEVEWLKAAPPAAGAMPWRLEIAARVLAEMAVADNMRTIAEDCCDALRYADALIAAAQAGGAK
jgi:hypothetical protein